jgi:sulfate/thiosulfate transport system ATP-binding protein
MSIDVVQVSKQFGTFAALQDVDLSVRRGELLALLGPSGSGKTTLLRIIAGLEWPDLGDVRLEGQSVLSSTARERRVGFVFQHYALFRHMTVFENVAFGMRVKPRTQRLHRREIRRRVEELLALVELTGLAGRYPSQLSGGQRQRVALVRALAIEPRVLLLDEPFGALDARVRKELRGWLRRLHDDLHITSVFVTHDQEEALEVADRIVVMNRGRIEQAGTPRSVYDAPASPFIYEFLGDAIRLPCTVRAGHVDAEGVDLAALEATGASEGISDGPAMLYVRPHDVEIWPASGGAGLVRAVFSAGARTKVRVSLEGQLSWFDVEIPGNLYRNLELTQGSRIALRVVRGRVFRPTDPPSWTPVPTANVPAEERIHA